ncbi:MAG TPA: single-stranded DNA-binding protein [Candidatus Angelobacter sp.]|nr:single-stranded DNA-binding protein [Candidatus Angelobacter sp.]
MALYENTIRLKGFLGRDAETKQTGTNPIIILSLATKSSYKDKQNDQWISRTEWHRIVCFAKTAQYANGLKKGDYVELTGALCSSQYDGEVTVGKKKATVKKRSWEIRATSVRKLARPEKPDAEPVPEADAA